MRFFIFVYGEKRERRFQVSKDNNNSCRILLPAEDFTLAKNIFLELQNISGEWYIQETENYKLKTEQFFQMDRQIKNESIFYRLNTGRKYDVIVGDQTICIQLICYEADWNVFRKFELRECKVVREKNKVIVDSIEPTPKMGVHFRHKQDKYDLVAAKEIKYTEVYFVHKQDKWLVHSCGTSEVYINEILVKEAQELVYGDVIYIFNRMFIFLGQYIAIEEVESKTEDNKGERYLKESSMNHIRKECFLDNRILREIFLEEQPLKEVSLNNQVKNSDNNSIGQKERKIEQTKTFHRAPRIMEELEQENLQINAPPILEWQKNRPVFMDIGAVINMMIPMLGMNLFLIYGTKSEQNQVGLYMYSGVFMAVLSAFCSVLWIVISRKYEEREQRRKISKKKYNYRKYLSKKDAFIKEIYERNSKVLQSRYLRADVYLHTSLLWMYLWNRNPYHKDFLMYRIGIGDMRFPVKIEIPQEEFSEHENSLWKEVKEIQKHYELLHQIPVLLDAGKYSQIGIVGENESRGMALIRSLILQIALSNCYTEVKVACVYDKDKEVQSGQWDFVRWLPHIWDSERKKRYIATKQAEARQLFYDLFQIFKEREGQNNSGKQEQLLPHYILFITENRFLEGEMFSKYIFNEDVNYGLTVIWITNERDCLPNTCKLVLETDDKFSGCYEVERHTQKREKINFDYTKKAVAEKIIRSISGIRVAEVKEQKGIPESIDFLSMYGAGKIEELEIERRWESNRIFESARVLIGKKTGGESCYLDIHERYHGPHGLIAGTTGSGKSEVLQTFILSMAVNFSPEEVNFLLIDYKGEGMAGLFANLPHISGKISNLSDGQAYRAMISIKSENRRRQTIFKRAGVNNINTYTKHYIAGQVTEPIPHLLIIIDEFAELKKAEPEFMQELISVAQVGRSLGVHLILATQKPGGVVDDKIWSNSRFRMCLKVQEREDSMDMLHNTDACAITQTGRGYLQVGNNELYELFQAGWSGAPFQKETKTVAAQIIQIDGTAYPLKKLAYDNTDIRWADMQKNKAEKQLESIPKNSQLASEMPITQLQAISTYISNLAIQKNCKKGKKLWLEPLPQYLYLEDILEQSEVLNQFGIIEQLGALNQSGKIEPSGGLNQSGKIEPSGGLNQSGKIEPSGVLNQFGTIEQSGALNQSEIINQSEIQKGLQSIDGEKNSLEKRLKVCIGLFDNPERQEQPIFSLNLMESGHIGICGRSGSGKSTFLQTFLYSLLQKGFNKGISLYLLDFNGGGMNIYCQVPQVKQIIQEYEEEKLDVLFKDIVKELKRRKQSFSGGNFRQYQNRNYSKGRKNCEESYANEKGLESEQRNINEQFPFILIILDGFADFSEETCQKYEEDLYYILREGEKLGVVVMVTLESFSGMHISLRLSELFKTKICFYMKDTYAYTEAFDIMQIPVFPKKGVAGRGLAYYGESILEFQTALAVRKENDYERQEIITELLKKQEKLDVC